jgi:uncharacterized protein
MTSPCESGAAAAKLVGIGNLSHTRYKPSRFNAHTIHPDGTLIVYNSFRGHSCAVPASWAAKGERLLSQLCVDGPLDALGQHLLAHGCIVEESTNEDALFDLRYGVMQYRQDTLELILLSHENCNFRCVYCSQEFNKEQMQPEVRRGVLNLIRSRISRLGRLEITWFGGEPMLGFEVIEELAPPAQQLAAEHNVRFSSSMTTNGYLLTPDRSRRMIEWGIRSYQVTIDGGADDHDSHRPLIGGGSTYRTIMDNLTAMAGFAGNFNVQVRVNFDNTNSRRLEPLFDDFRARVGSDKRFHFMFRPVGKWGGPHDDDLNVCESRDVLETGASLAREARSYGLNTLSSVELLKPSQNTVCYAARPYNYIVGADGKLMKCTQTLDTMRDNIVGRLLESGQMAMDDNRLAAWIRPYYHTDAMCSKCFFVPACQGVSCPLPRVAGGERPCPEQKLQIQQALHLMWDEKKAESQGDPAMAAAVVGSD